MAEATVAAVALHRRRALRWERLFRDRANPLELYSERECVDRYRFQPAAILALVVMLVNARLGKLTYRSNSLPPLLEVTIALRFYACGAFQQVVGDTLRVSKSTVCRVVGRVTKLLARHRRQFVVFPTTEDDMRRTKEMVGINLAGG